MGSGLVRRNARDRLDVDHQPGAEMSAEEIEEAVQPSLREARSLDDAQLQRARLRLEDLELSDEVTLIGQDIGEERPRHDTPVNADDERQPAAVDRLDQRQPAPTCAPPVGSHGTVASRIANQGNAVV